MNGELTQQQLYVNSGMTVMPPGAVAMAGLENQFQSLGFKQDDSIGTDQLSSSGPNSESNNPEETENEAEDYDEDPPMKLFVGQVPKNMNEEEIFPTFDSFGPLKDVAIIRDRHSGLHRGCAFVTFWSSADAQRAQEALHDKFTFPGARRSTQVKPAEPSVPENKLFIGMLSRKAGEKEIQELFAQFGEIREIYMIRNPDGTSKCAAFLRFVDRESALAAIENLNGNIMMEGAARPLIVKFADNKQQRQQRQIRSVRKHELMQPPVAYPVYPPPMPHMPMHPHAAAAPQYPQYAAATYGPPGQHPAAHPYMYPQHYAPHMYAYDQTRQDMRPPNPRPREGPAGANLFVYHLPHDLTDADLATAFNPFGNVLSAKVFVDKFTGESKGFGFVSYDSVISAETAIEQMNGFQIGNKRLKVQHKRVHVGKTGGYHEDDADPTGHEDSARPPQEG
ncbi:CUG-BP- and ETR3-like factor [Fistulifera solaris]|uniref:CUG-BP-and ETR3-like factor n=1 Tax=Fistulifera solaris TaxID=1519565 RepID=A0A1Z5JKI0_FISSO|nr:CUG-BP- and ETR3-like factor [Fistulifera solaris]|eukprot:GAX14499.1 CUG-BP- and ETR3-like factor [Fistulifera solaris]